MLTRFPIHKRRRLRPRQVRPKLGGGEAAPGKQRQIVRPAPQARVVRRLEAAVAPDADVQVVAERGAERGREAVLAERRRQSVDKEASQVRRGRRPAGPLPDDALSLIHI